MKIVALASPNIVQSFRFAGIRGYTPDAHFDVAQELRRLNREEDVGLVLVDNDIYRLHEEQFLDFIAKNAEPIVLVIPDEAGRVPDNTQIFKTLENLVGIRL